MQSVIRVHGLPVQYESLKELTRGRRVDQSKLREFVAGLGLPEGEAARLSLLTPGDYTGDASALVDVLDEPRA